MSHLHKWYFCICSNVDTNLSLTCHVYGPFAFRTSLGISILPITSWTWLKLFSGRCISYIYLAKLQLNEANTANKETFFLDLNIKFIGNNIHYSVYDKHNYFRFLIVNFPWLSDDVPRLQSCDILHFAVCYVC